MLGLNDTVAIKTRTHTTDGRGGVTTVLAEKIASLTCSLQPVRREELRMEMQGQTVTEPYMLLYENITTGTTVDPGDIVVHQNGTFLVLLVGTISGKGTHTEAILRKITGDAIVA